MSRSPVTPERIMQMASAYWQTKVLSTAVELAVFTHLAGGAATCAELAAAAGVPARGLRVVLNACVALGLLAKAGDRYANTAESDAFLVKGRPGYYGDMIIMHGTRLYDVWRHLGPAVRSGTPPEILFDHMYQCPETATGFIAAMHNNAGGSARHLAAAVDCAAFHALMDLGGGSGAYAIALAERYPQLRACVVDAPAVCAIAEGYIRASSSRERITTFGADIRTGPLPAGCDLALLSQVLHGCGEADGRRIVATVYDALESGGMLVINEFFLDEDETGPLFSALFAVNMFLETAEGTSHTRRRVSQWLTDAGFCDIAAIDLHGPSSVLTARKR